MCFLLVQSKKSDMQIIVHKHSLTQEFEPNIYKLVLGFEVGKAENSWTATDHLQDASRWGSIVPILERVGYGYLLLRLRAAQGTTRGQGQWRWVAGVCQGAGATEHSLLRCFLDLLEQG